MEMEIIALLLGLLLLVNAGTLVSVILLFQMVEVIGNDKKEK